ncbi:hypothetical protein B0I37DRAFT_443766 [Chaetomium sp. MPI-CAGE-AT-0009]|nr:hypothetical protein B0I37DRAFT_443766 [Chaetomium sp. MPI-CAGE-AT-0009]
MSGSEALPSLVPAPVHYLLSMYEAVASPVPEDGWLGTLVDPEFELLPVTLAIDPETSDSSERNKLLPDHEPRSAGEGDALASSGRDTPEVMAKGSHGNLDSVLGGWYPLSLQRRTMYGFMATFAALMISVEAIFIVSEKNQGLATALSGIGLHYIWTYGPTAIVSLIYAVWPCVEYSAKVSVPWIRIQNTKGESEVKSALLLDYISSFSLLVPFRAMKNKDALVATMGLVSHFLSIMIVFTPSMIRVTPVDVTLPSFDPSLDSTSELRATVEGFSAELDCRPASVTGFNYTIMLSTWTGAYQVNATVDLSIPGCDLSDRSLLFPLPFGTLPVDSQNENNTTYNVTDMATIARVLRGKCQTRPEDSNSDDLDTQRLSLVVADFLVHGTVRTTHTSDAGSRSWTDITNISCQRSQQVVCKPRYTISSIDIVRDNATKQDSISVSGIPRARTMTRVHAWDIAEAVLEAFEDTNGDYGTRMANVLGTVVAFELPQLYGIWHDFDPTSIAILGLGQPTYQDTNSFFNYTALILSLQTYYHVHAAFLAQSALMESVSEVSTAGYAKVMQNRLVVQPPASQVLAALSLLSIIGLSVGLFSLPRKFTLAGDPRTILGLKKLAKSFALDFPKGIGSWEASDFKTGVYRSRTCTDSAAETRRHGYEDKGVSDHRSTRKPTAHRPFSLRLVSRATACVAVAGVIVLLEVLLRRSQRDNDGIGTASLGGYIHYLWTLLPTLASSLIGMFFSSIDSELRTLASFYAMRSGPLPARQSVELNLQGLLGVHALCRQLKTRHFAAAMATVTAMVAGLLAIASASLFSEEDRPLVSEQHLRLVGSFSSQMYRDDYTYDVIFGVYPGSGMNEPGIISTLMLQSNLSAPAFTYQGLAFPTLSLDSNFTTQLSSSETETHAVVPALRSDLVCHQHPQADIVADILHFDHAQNITFISDGIWPAGDTIRVNVTGEFFPESLGKNDEPDPANLSVTALFHQDNPQASEGTFAATWPMGMNMSLRACSSYVYIWGHYSAGTVSAYALSCNASIESVDVDAVFLGDELAIHPNHPSRPKEETVREVIPAANSTRRFRGGIYQDLYPFRLKEPGVMMDSFFTALVTSPYGVPLSALADPASVGAVADAIKLQHSIVVAQMISSTARIPFPEYAVYHGTGASPNDTGVFDRTGQGILNITTYPATCFLGTAATNSSSRDNGTATSNLGRRRRVIQDPTATRIMQGLLGATLLFAVLSWALVPGTAVLPRPPTSVASVLSLLVDGNVYDYFDDEEKFVGKSRRPEDEENISTTSLIRGGGCEQADEEAGETKEVEERYGFWLGMQRSGSELTLPRRVSEGLADKEGETRFGIWVAVMQQDQVNP